MSQQPFDHFLPAAEMLRGLAEGRWSSTELIAAHRAQIERRNPTINAIIVDTLDQAEHEAREADNRRAREELTPLLGLPVTIKEAIDVAGLPATGGMPEHADRVPSSDAPLVRSLKESGAIILGKTNLPYACDDWQANSPVYGRTNNPWDLGRTPGGSTGGGSAALAAGMTPLEMGSDIGGSIRFPAAFCGVYGHRQSETLVPRSGHFPGYSAPNPAMVLNVMGPLARTPEDLELVLDIIAGPEPGETAAWSVTLPEPRHTRLEDFRVAVFPFLDWLPVSDAVQRAQHGVIDALSHRGATVQEAMPEGFGDLREYHRTYKRMLSSVTSIDLDRADREKLMQAARERGGEFDETVIDALSGSPADFLRWHQKREEYRRRFREFFERFDVLLSPVALTPPFKHIESTSAGLDDYYRTIDVDGKEIDYDLQVVYPGLTTLCGQPSTAFPAGLSEDGLPVGLQAIGPYLEDRTPLRFVDLLAQEIGGFTPPPGYV